MGAPLYGGILVYLAPARQMQVRQMMTRLMHQMHLPPMTALICCSLRVICKQELYDWEHASWQLMEARMT